MDLVSDLLSGALQEPIGKVEFVPVSGGSINQTFKLVVGRNRNFFCKLNRDHRLAGIFEKERNGLLMLAGQGLVRVPGIIACGGKDGLQVLILEWITQGDSSPACWRQLGEQLASLHQVHDPQFGLHEDNFMGSLPQPNQPALSWTEFFIRRRLEPQLALARQGGLLSSGMIRSFENLCKKLDEIFPAERPSLLHGDLWRGNFLCAKDSGPVLIDPAVYFGHRSMDLAMTTLFGGFGREFYESYQYHFPLPANHKEQWRICNLYPLLVHLNLFGTAYLGPIRDAIRAF